MPKFTNMSGFCKKSDILVGALLKKFIELDKRETEDFFENVANRKDTF